MRATRSRPSPWPFVPALAACVVFGVFCAAWGIDSWRQIGPAEAAVGDYQAAPPCADAPAPGCRAVVAGTIERAELRRVARSTNRQWVVVRSPATVQEIELPRSIRRRVDVPDPVFQANLPYPAFRAGAAVTAEWWEGRVVTLMAGTVREQTVAHPEQRAYWRRNSRDTALVLVGFISLIALFPVTLLLWSRSRWGRVSD